RRSSSWSSARKIDWRRRPPSRLSSRPSRKGSLTMVRKPCVATWRRTCSKFCMGAPVRWAGARYHSAMAQPGPAERILAAVRAIPRGEVAGDGEVGRRAGLPGRARLVARVLAESGEPGLPWHRVLRSDGRIAFPEGSRGWREQARRLRAEGVEVVAGRVRRPQRTVDAQVWGPD